MGTIAPFSAMSGAATNAMSLLRTGVIQPSALTVSSSVLPSNAALFHAAAAASGGSQPAAASSVSSVAAPPDLIVPATTVVVNCAHRSLLAVRTR